MKAVHIEWDVDNEEDLQSLPMEIEIPDGMTDEDEISDYLSEVTGFCHRGFSLSTADETPEKPKAPTIILPLPDGTALRAVAYADDSYPAINVYWDSAQAGDQNLIGFAEYNPEKPAGYEVCVGAYRSDQEDTVYYRPYMAERESNEDNETWRYADRL